MSLRSSAEILGLPAGLRDRSRQYDWNPPRCQRMIVSGRRIAIAPRMEGNQRLEPNQQKAIGIVKLWSLRYLPAKYVELLAKD
jgi:hypothetical protein